MKPRRVPMRMCVGCREMQPKKELLRVVRTPDGKLEVDRTGKKSGRGAYICPRRRCLDAALKGKRLQKALAMDLSAEIIRELEDRLVEI
ncbi:MAG TPA: YlxR family protein [Firmicutes bacterium]|nr:YlxR family protein [Bacillota bacterium]